MRHILFIYFMFSVISAFSQNTQISPGVLWNDINGEQINAHGGCVVFENITGLEKIVQALFLMG